MIKRISIDLDKLATAIQNEDNIDLTNKDHIKSTELIIVKRDGREEPYSIDKMKKVVLWACDGEEIFADELLNDTEIKLYARIKITDVYDEIIKTAANKISLLYPQWEYITAKLFLLKIYKDSWNVKTEGCYPNYKDVIQKGVQNKIYDRDTIAQYSDEEIATLGEYIDQKRDYLFTWKALYTFYEKYCLNYSKTRNLELPQHVYMRVSMALHVNDGSDRIARIKETYDNLSTHKFTVATPITINAMTPNQNLASCVLNAVDDDSHSILDSTKNLGIYSKFRGGTALDVSLLRSKGSYIVGNQGHSSGPVPFIKIVESTMKAFNQGSSRPGACCIYFQWWHMDVEDMIVLKSNGGTDENRARGLKYAVKVNDLFLRRLINNEDISIFDPKDVPELFGVWGKEFDRIYHEYEDKQHIRRKKIAARDLWFKIMKERTETGNIYLFHEENVNNSSMVDEYVNSSNLCMEITEYSRPSKSISEEYITKENGDREIIKRYNSGEISLCNLASINLVEYYKLSKKKRKKLIFNIVSTMDNTIDVAYYPVKEGSITNHDYRYLGIGVNNFVNYLASKKIVIDSDEALTETHKIFDEISYNVLSASNELAIQRGAFPKFFKSKWSNGNVPLDFANKEAMKLGNYEPDHVAWNELKKSIKLHGLRNALTMAIAPTATSGKSINATESIEPIQNLFYREEGTFSVATIVPNFRKNNKYYKKSFDCDQRKLVELAAIRQCYLDQSQSINLYYKSPDSLLELTKDHLYGFKLGIKTYYYLKSEKDTDEETCESCT